MLYINPVETSSFRSGDFSLNSPRRAEQAFKELEQLFSFTLLREMRKSIPDNGLFPKSSEMKFYEEMLDEIISFQMAESGQLGLAKMLQESLELNETKGADAVEDLPSNKQAPDSQ